MSLQLLSPASENSLKFQNQMVPSSVVSGSVPLRKTVDESVTKRMANTKLCPGKGR